VLCVDRIARELVFVKIIFAGVFLNAANVAQGGIHFRGLATGFLMFAAANADEFCLAHGSCPFKLRRQVMQNVRSYRTIYTTRDGRKITS
jgi:hypothetical protein